MNTITQILELARKNYPYRIQRYILNILTKYHRIQGSGGLRDAVKDLSEVLESEGVETKIYGVEPEGELDIFLTPPSWDLVYGEITVYENNSKILSLNTIEHPTLVAGHSPAGSGSGTICSIDIMGFRGNAPGSALLTRERVSLALIHSRGKGIDLIIWYSPEREASGVPYTGIFLPRKIIGGQDIPVVTLPYKYASRIAANLLTGSSYRVEWNVETRFGSSEIPILEASVGEGSYDVVVVAHICHPYPGAHDNASGCAAIASALITLYKLRNKINYNTRIRFFWVPEYTGTIALFKKGVIRVDRTLCMINYDMVGSIQELTGSTMHIIRGFLGCSSIATPIIDLAIRISIRDSRTFLGQPSMGSISFEETSYEYGSDHDIFVVNGIDSVMINEWPSKYYHTDLDSPRLIGDLQLRSISIALVAALAMITDPRRFGDGLLEYVKSYYEHVMSWYIMESIARGIDRGFVLKNIAPDLRGSVERAFSWIKELKLETAHKGEPIYKSASPITLTRYAIETGNIELYRSLTRETKLVQTVTVMYPSLMKLGCRDIRHALERSLAEIMVDPSTIGIKYKGKVGFEALMQIVNDLNAWLAEKGVLKLY